MSRRRDISPGSVAAASRMATSQSAGQSRSASGTPTLLLKLPGVPKTRRSAPRIWTRASFVTVLPLLPTTAPPFSQLLQCFQRIRHLDNGAAIVMCLPPVLWEYHPDGAVCQRIAREFMTVGPRARQSEEDASLHDVLGVDGHMPDEIVLWCPAGHAAANDVGQVGDADCIHRGSSEPSSFERHATTALLDNGLQGRA